MNEVPGGQDGRPEPSKDFVQGRPQSYGGQAPKPDWRQYARVFLWLVVAIIAAAFLMLNRQEVTISFVFFTASVPLFIALLVAVVLGVLLGGSVMWWSARRRRRAAARTA